MSWVMVDIEADGPIPGDFSMVSLGAVIIEDIETKDLKSFFGLLRPISDKWLPQALKVSGFSREKTMEFPEAKVTMQQFGNWLTENSKGRPMFISDNNGFDWMFTCWYFWHFLDCNPFGHSSTNLGSLYKGMVKDMRKNFKRLRKTKHTHHPVDDCKGNVEALLAMRKDLSQKNFNIPNYGLRMKL